MSFDDAWLRFARDVGGGVEPVETGSGISPAKSQTLSGSGWVPRRTALPSNLPSNGPSRVGLRALDALN